MADSTSSIVSPAAVRFVSSANSRGLTCLRQSGRSFMYRVYKKGNPTLACHCTLITKAYERNFCMVIKSKAFAVE